MTKLLIKVGVVVVLIVVSGIVAVKIFGAKKEESPGIFEPKVNEKVTLSVLKSEAMSFLVTRRTTTQLVVEHSESSLFGEWDGVYWVTVRWHWGVDLRKLTKANLRQVGNKLICHLPDPERLELGLVPGTERFYTRSTAVFKVRELFNSGEQLQTLQALVERKAEDFAKTEGLAPTRKEIAKQLNDSHSFFRLAGIDIEFE